MSNMKYTHLVSGFCLVVLTACLGCATAQRGAIMRAQSAMDDGKYVVALKRLSQGESYTKPTPVVGSQMYYMKGVCYEGLHKTNEAQAMFKYVVDHFPDTDYGYMAKEKIANK
jgi:outer membrane protein assembly factor BamD (BamD/ComL family)